MVKYNLYSSEGCHLCELALAICEPLIEQSLLTVVDIVDSEKLVERYGVHIPVLEKMSPTTEETTDKLFWPFSTEQVKAFIQ